MAPRGCYKKIPLMHRQRLIEAYEGGSCWKSQAEHLDVKYKTAESTIRKDRKIYRAYISRHEIEPRQRGGARNFKVSQRMRDELSNNVNDHPEYVL